VLLLINSVAVCEHERFASSQSDNVFPASLCMEEIVP
jgi:hypothetical protein